MRGSGPTFSPSWLRPPLLCYLFYIPLSRSQLSLSLSFSLCVYATGFLRRSVAFSFCTIFLCNLFFTNSTPSLRNGSDWILVFLFVVFDVVKLCFTLVLQKQWLGIFIFFGFLRRGLSRGSMSFDVGFYLVSYKIGENRKETEGKWGFGFQKRKLGPQLISKYCDLYFCMKVWIFT